MKATKNASSVHGILLLNKSQGMSSNAALQKVKRLFAAKKAGHTGSLDPLATGMLPICFGEATKISQYFLNADKAYTTTAQLGIKTDTSDATGKITAKLEDFSVTKAQLTEVLERYKGNTKQVPSMFSALKHKGRPLYSYAREGIEIEREAREIIISQLQLDAFDEQQFTLAVTCSKGTYIRNLIEDIGDDLGVGAHVASLHRVYTSGFEESPMYSLSELEEMNQDEKLACLLPMDKVIEFLPKIDLIEDEVLAIRQGRTICVKKHGLAESSVRLYDEKGQFIGLGCLGEDGRLKAKRLLAY